MCDDYIRTRGLSTPNFSTFRLFIIILKFTFLFEARKLGKSPFFAMLDSILDALIHKCSLYRPILNLNALSVKITSLNMVGSR